MSPLRRSVLRVLRLDFDVDTRGDVELLQRFHGLTRGARDVDEPLVDADLELLARLLVHVRAAEHRVHGLRGRQRHRPRRDRARAARRAHDLRRRLVQRRVVVRFELDADLLEHSLPRQAWMSVTTPAPTVRPPSRIAKRSSFSIAIGVINSTTMSTLSPGITISRPSGSVATPVTSVVRK